MMNTTTLKGTIEEIDEIYAYMSIYRNSGKHDLVRLRGSNYQLEVGKRYLCKGVVSAANYYSVKENKNKTHLYSFLDSSQEIEAECPETSKDFNHVNLEATLVKATCRETPQGRTIADVILVINVIDRHGRKKSMYIPSITWGRFAIKVSDLPAGTILQTKGRMQSREYVKNDTQEIAYEYNIMSFTIKNQEEKLNVKQETTSESY